MPEEESSELKSTVYRYDARQTPFELAFGDGSSIEEIDAHIETYLGPVEMVYHEIISDLVHIDVHHVAPRPGRLYHTLITSGMSDKPMTTPPPAFPHRYAELMICLPYTWKLSEAAFRDEVNYWPVRLLKRLARFPHEYQTWLGWGHTVPNGDPMEPFTPETKLSCALLSPSILAGPDFFELTVSPEKTIRFFCIWPLYAEETDFKLKHGTEALAEKFKKNGITEIVDLRRKNVCKSALWPF